MTKQNESNKTNIVVAVAAKKPAVKKKSWYMKDEFFNKRETGVKRKSKDNVKAVSKPVDFKWMTVKGTLIKFEKGKALTDQELALFEDGKNGTFNQKDHYLIQK